MRYEVYLTNFEWNKIEDNLGGVTGNIVLKNSISHEEFEKLINKKYLLLEEKQDKKIIELQETIRKANNNIIKDISMIKIHEMTKQEIIQRLYETLKILEEVIK